MLTVIVGVPCSGKTTLAQTFPRYLSFDWWVEKRYGVPFKEAMRIYRREYPAGDKEWLETVCQAYAGGDLAIEDALVTRRLRMEALAHFRSRGVGPLRLVYLDVPLEVLLKRNETRERPHRPELVERFFRAAELPKPDEGWDSIVVRTWRPNGGQQKTENGG